MAETQSNQQGNAPTLQYPSRTIIITGERVARMLQASVRVSRIEQRFVQLSMAKPQQSTAARKAIDRFNQACTQLEQELGHIENEMEAASRAGQDRRSNSGKSEPRRENRQTLSRDQGKANGNPQKTPSPDKQTPPAKQPQANGQKTQQGKQASDNSQLPEGQRLTKRQKREAREAAGATAANTATAATAKPSADAVGAVVQKAQEPAQQSTTDQQPATPPNAAPAALASL